MLFGADWPIPSTEPIKPVDEAFVPVEPEALDLPAAAPNNTPTPHIAVSATQGFEVFGAVGGNTGG